jgi:hypothetical protein
MARFSHPTAGTVDLILTGIDIQEQAPTHEHKTAYGTVLRYVLGTRWRTGSLDLMVTSKAQRDAFFAFYRAVTLSNARFTFIEDTVNYPFETWSALFVSDPKYTPRRMPGARVVGTITVDIQDAPTSL